MPIEFYDFDEIVKFADCVDVAKNLLGLNVVNNRTNAVWRGGDNKTAVALTKDGWYDHVEKTGGSVIRLVMLVKNCDALEAGEILGKYLNLKPKQILKVANHRKIEAEYIYKNERGEPIHKTVRYQPKDFAQFHYENGEWKPGLNGVELVPYNLHIIKDFSTIYVHEGEKACEAAINFGLVNSTTFALGAKNWKPYYAKYFVGKDIIVCADNDDVGKEHAQKVVYELRNVVKSAKIIVPSKKDKGDFWEFVNEEGGTKEILDVMVSQAQFINLKQLEIPTEVKVMTEIEIAKKANQTPFANFVIESYVDDNGNTKHIKKPIPINDLVKEVHKRLLNFPRRVGTTLFDHDRNTNNIREIRNANDLAAWIAEKTKNNINFAKIQGAVTMEQLYSALYNNSIVYEMISGVPHYPLRDDVYYTFGSLPPPTENAEYFCKFCSFFEPATIVDAALLMVAIATPLYYEPLVERPLFVIDTERGSAQGTGKTKLCEMIARLYGTKGDEESCIPVLIFQNFLDNENLLERINKRLLSAGGRRKRCVLIDNITGFFSSTSLASLITMAGISGIAPYGRGEETRRNDLTYFLTSNNAHLCSDLISRSIIIKIKKPVNPMKNWEINVRKFIDMHRLQIISDIIGRIERNKEKFSHINNLSTRFKAWERNIMIPIIGDENIYNEVIKQMKDRHARADGELMEADTIRDAIIKLVTNSGMNPSKHLIWLPSYILTEICQKEIPGFGGKTGRGIMYILRNYIQNNKFPELCDLIEKYPHNGVNRSRGLLWDAQGKYREASSKFFKNGKPKIYVVKSINNGMFQFEENTEREETNE